MYRGILVSLICFFIFSSGPVSAHADSEPDKFIMEIADKALTTLTDQGLDDKVRQDRFRMLLNENIDIPYILQRVLGPYIRRVKEEEMMALQSLLEDFLVLKYSALFKEYTGEKLEISGTRNGRSGKKVVSLNVFPKESGPPIPVLWIVRPEGNSYLITDIRFEGVSMVTTLKEDFISIIRRGQGKIQALIDDLAERNKEFHS
jgi:ABC-type transporter MlaC component